MRGVGVNDVDGWDILSPKDVGGTRGIELQACGDHDLKVSWRRTSPILPHNNSFVLTKSCFSNEVDWFLFVIGQKLDKSIEKNCHVLCHVCIFPSPVFFRESKLQTLFVFLAVLCLWKFLIFLNFKLIYFIFLIHFKILLLKINFKK